MKTLKTLSILALAILSVNAFAQDGELPSDELAATTLRLTGGVSQSDETANGRHDVKIWFIDGERYDHNPFYLTAIGHSYCMLSLNVSSDELSAMSGPTELSLQPATFVKKTRTGAFISVVKYPVQNGTLTCVAGMNTLSLKIKNVRHNLGNELVLGD